jgi:ribulose kinase
MIPGLWLNEGGQSATGALLDFIISNHPRHGDAQKEAKTAGITIYECLNEKVEALARDAKVPLKCHLTNRFHMLPYFHGNRSPNADPLARGAIHGLTLHATMEDLALLYYATIQAIAYGTRDIIEALNSSGYAITRLNACGGGTKNPLWLQEHADATQCEIQLPKEPEAMLLGSAMLAAMASGLYRSFPEAMTRMTATGATVRPDKKSASYHAAKIQVHRELYADQQKYDKICAVTNV